MNCRTGNDIEKHQVSGSMRQGTALIHTLAKLPFLFIYFYWDYAPLLKKKH